MVAADIVFIGVGIGIGIGIECFVVEPGHRCLPLPPRLAGRRRESVEAVKGMMTIDPDQLLAANVNTARQQNYLGRGSNGKCFTGALDNFSVYSKGMDCAKSDVLKVVEEELDKGELKTVGAAQRRRR